MLISEFYKNQVVFITGGTGFIGKALIEKLLRSCPDIAKIYFLVRAKKGKTPQERLEVTLKDGCFRQLWKERPEVFKKIQTIEGDCRKLHLGISNEDLECMRDISIIVHSAATVRFDEPLRDAILMNTRSTFELVKIAEKLRNLKAFIHISTGFCNPEQKDVHEKVYKPIMDWREAINFAENLDDEILSLLTQKISNDHPNTYTFTKSLGEQIIYDHKDKLPLTIFRPSIVMPALKEPIPGWTDNVNGPIGVLIACGTGLRRCELCDSEAILAVVPIDIVVRGIILAGYKTGLDRSKSASVEKELVVYNCSLDSTSPLSINKLIRTGEKFVKDYPLEKTVWVPGGIMYKIKLFYLLQVIVQQLPFAILLDGLLTLNGKKPLVVKLQRVFVNTSKALSYFMFNSFSFKAENFFALEKIISPQEIDQFGFTERCYVDYEEYYPDLIYGMREFLLKEPREPTAAAHKRMKIFCLIHNTLQVVTLVCFSSFLFGKIFL